MRLLIVIAAMLLASPALAASATSPALGQFQRLRDLALTICPKASDASYAGQSSAVVVQLEARRHNLSLHESVLLMDLCIVYSSGYLGGLKRAFQELERGGMR